MKTIGALFALVFTYFGWMICFFAIMGLVILAGTLLEAA